MKSAYELAMERLNKEQGPAKQLSEEQKARIAEVDRKIDAQVAEAKLGFEQKLASAAKLEEVTQLREELAAALTSLEERREREKEKIWTE